METKVSTIEGVKINYRPNTKDARVIEEVFIKRCYRHTRVHFDVEAGERWLDLGAHIGVFSLYCDWRGASSVGYEPEKDNFALLVKNVGKKRAIRGAVTHQPDKHITLYQPKNNKGRADGYALTTKFMTHYSNRYNSVGEVPNFKFTRELCKGFTCIKFDIEGAEHGILDYFPQLPDSIRKVVLEYHFRKDTNMERFGKRLQKLKDQFTSVKYPAHLDRFLDEGLEDFPGLYDRLIHCER